MQQLGWHASAGGREDGGRGYGGHTTYQERYRQAFNASRWGRPHGQLDFSNKKEHGKLLRGCREIQTFSMLVRFSNVYQNPFFLPYLRTYLEKSGGQEVKDRLGTELSHLSKFQPYFLFFYFKLFSFYFKLIFFKYFHIMYLKIKKIKNILF